MFSGSQIGCIHFVETRHPINVHISKVHKFSNKNDNVPINGSIFQESLLVLRNLQGERMHFRIDRTITAAYEDSTDPIDIKEVLPDTLKLSSLFLKLQ